MRVPPLLFFSLFLDRDSPNPWYPIPIACREAKRAKKGSKHRRRVSARGRARSQSERSAWSNRACSKRERQPELQPVAAAAERGSRSSSSSSSSEREAAGAAAVAAAARERGSRSCSSSSSSSSEREAAGAAAAVAAAASEREAAGAAAAVAAAAARERQPELQQQ